MNSIIQKHRIRCQSLSLGILFSVASVTQTQAAATITSDVTFDSLTNLYTYSYSIQNTGLLDLILITIPVSPLANITNISPPTGFSLTYDPVAQVNALFEDNDIFTDNTFAPNTTISPFTFRSPLGPGVVTFIASDVNEDFSGTTLSPVPEPSGIMLTGIAALAAMIRRRRF